MLVDSLFEITHVPHSIHITRGGMDLVAHHTISMSQPDNSVTNQIAECYSNVSPNVECVHSCCTVPLSAVRTL